MWAARPAFGVLGVCRCLRQRKAGRQAAPATSFLLHTRNELSPRNLLSRTLRQVARIAGAS